jgi:hypothetical protein
VGKTCESASARQLARRFQLSASTVQAIDLRYLEPWAAGRQKRAVRQNGDRRTLQVARVNDRRSH